MNKKKLKIMAIIGIAVLLLLSTFIVEIAEGNILVIPEKSLYEIDDLTFGRALNYSEMTGGEILQKRHLIRELITEMTFSKEDHWDEIERLLEEIDELDDELRYRGDIFNQIHIIYSLEKNGIHFFGYVFSSIGRPPDIPMGIRIDYEKEIDEKINELEILREDYIRKRGELGELIYKREINIEIRTQIYQLLQEVGYHKYYEKRHDFRYLITYYKLKNSESLDIFPSWEEGEHRLSNFERYHVWVGMYNTEEPGMDNFLGSFTTDEYSPDMNFYWEEALKKNPEAKSIRIKWIYVSEEHKIVWEGNKSEKEEWYTFAKYEGEPREGTYDVVNMNLLNYPDFQQYYVVSVKPKKSFIVMN